jgi:hypothetical protein
MQIVVAVFVDPDTARRPVMVDKKVYVRTEAGKTPADWYRLRELFAELPPGAEDGPTLGRSVGMLQMYPVSDPPPFIVLRLAVLVQGPRGQRARIHERGRTALVEALNNIGRIPLTGRDGALPTIAYNHLPRWGQVGWTPAGENNSTKATLEWALISPAEVRITEARLAAETSGPSALRPYLILQLDVMVRGGDSLPGSEPTVLWSCLFGGRGDARHAVG